MTEKTFATLRSEEGFRPYVYDDATGQPIVPGYTVIGHPTIWYGLCLERGRVPKIPERIPRDVLEYVAVTNWLDFVEGQPWADSQPEHVKDALMQMTYQLGAAGVEKFKLMIAALKRGDLETAAFNVIDSDFGRDPKTSARAKRVANLMRGDSLPSTNEP